MKTPKLAAKGSTHIDVANSPLSGTMGAKQATVDPEAYGATLRLKMPKDVVVAL